MHWKLSRDIKNISERFSEIKTLDIGTKSPVHFTAMTCNFISLQNGFSKQSLVSTNGAFPGILIQY